MAMELDNSFTVPVPPDQAWDVLLDVERIAPCMPGATVDEVEGDVVNGRIKVKVGPVSLTYKGTAKFIERDPEARVVVLEASGKETRGAGTASANVRASMAPDASGSGTEVTMHTTMNVTGRPAQFGRGVMLEVGGKLVDQFAANLSQLITGDTGGGSPAQGVGSAGGNGSGAAATPVANATNGPVASTTDEPVASTTDEPVADATDEPVASPAASATAPVAAPAPVVAPAPAPAQEDSLNLVKLVGPVVLKRLVPVAAGAAGLALLGRIFWRLRHRRARKA
jgi:carbon monoxide dehydrogenase subunit G